MVSQRFVILFNKFDTIVALDTYLLLTGRSVIKVIHLSTFTILIHTLGNFALDLVNRLHPLLLITLWEAFSQFDNLIRIQRIKCLIGVLCELKLLWVDDYIGFSKDMRILRKLGGKSISYSTVLLWVASYEVMQVLFIVLN